MFISLLYSLGLMGLWYFLVQDIGYLGYWGLALALLLSFYSPFLLRSFRAEEPRALRLVALVLPSCFLLYSLVTEGLSAYDFFHPLLWAFLLFAAALLSSPKRPPLHYHFFALFICYFYPLKMYDAAWSSPKLKALALSMYVYGPRKEIKEKKPKEEFRLEDFAFVNADLDTIALESQGKFSIIETWNEKCPPCMKAIPEMSPFYKEIEAQAQQYYLYIPSTSRSQTLDIEQVFAFDKIEDKSKILIDQDLQQRMGFDYYPVFLLFDQTGLLIYQYPGYKSSTELISELKKQMGIEG